MFIVTDLRNNGAPTTTNIEEWEPYLPRDPFPFENGAHCIARSLSLSLCLCLYLQSKEINFEILVLGLANCRSICMGGLAQFINQACCYPPKPMRGEGGLVCPNGDFAPVRVRDRPRSSPSQVTMPPEFRPVK